MSSRILASWVIVLIALLSSAAVDLIRLQNTRGATTLLDHAVLFAIPLIGIVFTLFAPLYVNHSIKRDPALDSPRGRDGLELHVLGVISCMMLIHVPILALATETWSLSTAQAGSIVGLFLIVMSATAFSGPPNQYFNLQLWPSLSNTEISWEKSQTLSKNILLGFGCAFILVDCILGRGMWVAYGFMLLVGWMSVIGIVRRVRYQH